MAEDWAAGVGWGRNNGNTTREKSTNAEIRIKAVKSFHLRCAETGDSIREWRANVGHYCIAGIALYKAGLEHVIGE